MPPGDTRCHWFKRIRGKHRRKELTAMIYLVMKLIRKLKRRVPN